MQLPMPISASAKKSLRVSLRKAAINRRRKLLIKTALKNVTADSLAKTISLVDKGVKWGIFHRNKAARLKSRLMRTTGTGATTASEKTSIAKTAKTTTRPSSTKNKASSQATHKPVKTEPNVKALTSRKSKQAKAK